MANNKEFVRYHLTDTTAGTYAILDIPVNGDPFTLTPTDATYENPISLDTIDGSYCTLYYEAIRLQAQTIGTSSGTEQEIETRIGWVNNATQFDVIHPDGTWSFTNVVEQDVFLANKSELLNYLNEVSNDVQPSS